MSWPGCATLGPAVRPRSPRGWAAAPPRSGRNWARNTDPPDQAPISLSGRTG